jgi:hypothetical protein
MLDASKLSLLGSFECQDQVGVLCQSVQLGRVHQYHVALFTWTRSVRVRVSDRSSSDTQVGYPRPCSAGVTTIRIS